MYINKQMKINEQESFYALKLLFSYCIIRKYFGMLAIVKIHTPLGMGLKNSWAMERNSAVF